MRIVGVYPYFWSGSQHYRLDLPGRALKEAGHEVYVCSSLTNRSDQTIVGLFEDGRRVEDADIIILSTLMTGDLKDIVLRARAAGQLVIGDLEDDYWALEEDNIAYRGTDPEISPFINRAHLWEILHACDAIMCSTTSLAERMSDHPEVVVLPNMVDLELWDTNRDLTGNAVVGWTGNTLYRQNDLRLIAKVVGPFVNDNEIPFVHIGDRPGAAKLADLLGINPELMILQPASKFDDFVNLVRESPINIGIVPLVDSEFNRAKSCVKGMEFAAAGIPFVHSCSPEYDRLGAGIKADNLERWKVKLIHLLGPSVRQSVAEWSYKQVALQDYRVRGHEWVEFLEGIY